MEGCKVVVEKGSRRQAGKRSSGAAARKGCLARRNNHERYGYSNGTQAVQARSRLTPSCSCGLRWPAARSRVPWSLQMMPQVPRYREPTARSLQEFCARPARRVVDTSTAPILACASQLLAKSVSRTPLTSSPIPSNRRPRITVLEPAL
jgi:hypothetical protein